MSRWVQSWNIEGSKGDIYKVSVDQNGCYGCDCPVWKFKRQECKHILKLKYILGQDSMIAPVRQPEPVRQVVEPLTLDRPARRFAFNE